MKAKFLQFTKALKAILLILLISVFGMEKMYAQNLRRVSRNAIMQPAQQKEFVQDSDSFVMQDSNNLQGTIRSDGELDYTTYDWQSNAGAITRTIVWPDGKINFAFTQAFSSNFTDRGTAIGTYDAVNDQWIPSEGRVENQRTGFGSIAQYGENGIVLAAHTGTSCCIYILEDKDNIVSNSFSYTSILDNTFDVEWPNVMTSGPNRNIIHVVATAYDNISIPGMENVNQPILYFRSQDGGQTWDKQNFILPYMDANYCLDWGSNVCYWMETTDDNCLALVVNNAWSDGMVLYSYDNGDTWQRKVFYKHPNPFGYFDNMFLYPRWVSCQWDSQHHLHVLYEYNGCIGEPGSGSYYPAYGGVAYWNETMPYNINGTTQSAIPGNLTPGQPFVMDTAYLYHDIYASWWLWSDASHEMWPEYVGYLPPLDNYGNWEDPYQTNSFNIDDRSLHGSYNSGVCAFPVLCMVPGTDDMVAVWCAMDENHTDSNGNYYYKLFASTSVDGGATWNTMKHLTTDFMWDYSECVYPQAAVVGDQLIIACQMDELTGTYVQSDDFEPFDNYYQGLTFNLEELFNYVPNYGICIRSFANPQIGGIVRGGGYYQEGDTCTLTATSKIGYAFNNWTKNDSVVSTNAIYSFIVTEDATFVANFVEQTIFDTTFYSEICHGEDYLQNGFEIYWPEVGENQYSITLPSSQGTDSIVHLMLTVYPTYYIVEDTTLCEMTPYYWHGNTYTESGLYYDTLQTIHGCDSIFQLSLELFNTPLGEFTYMTPTNNYPFTSLPITFSWDAVSGVEYYNLYLWNANDPVPSEPISSNIYNRSYYASSLQNHQTYNWYVEAVNTCFSTTSSVRSFSLNIPPTMNVSQSSLSFGEVALNNSNTLNLYVSGNALNDAITMQITGEDASMFSFEQGSNWNNLTGGSLSVTFSPTTVQYNYTANLVITTGTLTQTVQLTGSLADMFVFNTYVEQDVFPMNSTVPIYGTVMDLSNNPAPSAEVEVKVTVMNMTRSLFATTGTDGHFSVDFVPANSESGYYTINSGRIGHNSTAVHDDFNIPGMNLVTNGWILWDVVQNETTTGSIVIRNRSQIPLTNIQVTANTLPEGCSFTFQPLSLEGMEEGVLEYSVSGTTPTNGYQEVALVATSSEGATMNFTVWYRCTEPRGILYASPNNIITSMTKGINKIVDVMLYNNGTGPTGSVYLDLPSVDWLSVVGNDTLPSIPVQDSAYFSLRLSAKENTPLVQYTGNIAVNCERGDGLSLPYTIMAVSDSTGTLIVDVTDDYTYNGNGQHLAGATITVKGYYSLETVAEGLTNNDGLFTISNIPEGYYRMLITAPRHSSYQSTILIEGGQTNNQDIYLQYQAITWSWNVVPTEIEDEYTLELITEYETNVPVPVVVIDMPRTFPELEAGESYVFDYVISNYGLVDAYEATLYPPENHPLYDFVPLITEIDTIHAQSTLVIPCTMTTRTQQRSQAVMEVLNGGVDREEMECPYSSLTKSKQRYPCGDRQNWIWAHAWRNIGSTPCQTAPSNVNPSEGSGPGGGGNSGGSGGGSGSASSSSSSTPPVTVQNDDCNLDPCLTNTKETIDNCDNNGSETTPNLPPRNPANNR